MIIPVFVFILCPHHCFLIDSSLLFTYVTLTKKKFFYMDGFIMSFDALVFVAALFRFFLFYLLLLFVFRPSVTFNRSTHKISHSKSFFDFYFEHEILRSKHNCTNNNFSFFMAIIHSIMKTSSFRI